MTREPLPLPLLSWASETFIRSQIAAEWLQIAQWSQWRAYRKPPSLFLMVWSTTPCDLPFPQMGSSKCTPRDISNFEWLYLRNGWSGAISGSIKSKMAATTWYDMAEEFDKRRVMSPFAKLLWPLCYILVTGVDWLCVVARRQKWPIVGHSVITELFTELLVLQRGRSLSALHWERLEHAPITTCMLTLCRPLLPYGYSYKAFCVWPG